MDNGEVNIFQGQNLGLRSKLKEVNMNPYNIQGRDVVYFILIMIPLFYIFTFSFFYYLENGLPEPKTKAMRVFVGFIIIMSFVAGYSFSKIGS